MKKLFKQLLLFSALGGMLIFTSCGDDDPEPVPIVTINVSGDTDTQNTFSVGETINFTIDYTADAGISSFIYTPTVDGTEQSPVFLNPSADLGIDLETQANAGSFDFSFNLDDPNLAGSNISIRFTIVDQQNGEASETVTFDVAAATPATVYTAQLLYAQLASEDSKTFFSTNLGVTVSKNEVDASAAPNSSDIDFGYAAGASGTLWLASPASYPTFTNYDLSIWNTLNVTTFREVNITNEEYLAIDTNGELSIIFEDGVNPEDRKEGIAQGDIFAFQLDVDKGGGFGVVKIMDVVDGNNDGDFIDSTDYIEIEVIVQS